MANVTINDLAAKTTPADTDEFELQETSGGASKKITRANLLQIGTDVQAHSAVLDATTASFLTADETKLDGIEALADVTDATNVEAAGAVMESDTTTASMSFVIDDDTMATATATVLPSAESVKAYVDASVTKVTGVNAQTGTTYTLVLADAGKMVTLTNAAAITMTVPPNSSVAFAVGTWVHLSQGGAGQVTVAEGAGVTVNTSETLKISGQHAVVGLLKLATDTWLLTGEREAAA